MSIGNDRRNIYPHLSINGCSMIIYDARRTIIVGWRDFGVGCRKQLAQHGETAMIDHSVPIRSGKAWMHDLNLDKRPKKQYT
jgi:hypothetical protein